MCRPRRPPFIAGKQVHVWRNWQLTTVWFLFSCRWNGTQTHFLIFISHIWDLYVVCDQFVFSLKFIVMCLVFPCPPTKSSISRFCIFTIRALQRARQMYYNASSGWLLQWNQQTKMYCCSTSPPHQMIHPGSPGCWSLIPAVLGESGFTPTSGWSREFIAGPQRGYWYSHLQPA